MVYSYSLKVLLLFVAFVSYQQNLEEIILIGLLFLLLFLQALLFVFLLLFRFD